MKIVLSFVLDTERPGEELRDQIAQLLGEYGTVLHTSCGSAQPKFVVRGVNVDKRKSKPEPFEEIVQAENQAEAREKIASGTHIVAHVVPHQ